MTALERADPSFTSRSPAEGHAVTPRAGFAGLAREHDVPDPALASSALVRRRSKAAIGDGELRGAVKELDMPIQGGSPDRKSTRLNSSHTVISYAVFCLKKKK